jgi:hypothetical protein
MKKPVSKFAYKTSQLAASQLVPSYVTVMNLNKQAKLFSHDFRPVFRVHPSMKKYDRLKAPVVGLYKFANPVVTHSLKPPGFNP